MKSSKSHSIITLIAFASLSLGSCSKYEDAGDSKFLSLGSAPAGGAFFVVGNAIAATLNEADSAWEITSEATKGTQENIRRLESGELDIALANSAISYFAVRGEGAWEKKYPLRTIMTLAPNVAMFVTPKSSGVKTIQDLKGKRVYVGPSGAGFEYFLKPILEAHGVSYDDFSPQNAIQSAAVDMLADGSISAAFLGGAVPTPAITQAATSMDLVFVPFDEATKQELIAKYLFFRPATVPAKSYRNQDEDFHGLDVGSMQLITSESKSEDQVYKITKTLYENAAAVSSRHPAGKAINPKNAVRSTGTPFHPGSIRFYKEIGIWPSENG